MQNYKQNFILFIKLRGKPIHYGIGPKYIAQFNNYLKTQVNTFFSLDYSIMIVLLLIVKKDI